MPIFFALQPFRGVVLLDGLTLYDHGRVTAFDATRGRGHRPCHVAGGQHHRETYRQGGEQCQEDLFYVLFHCAENLVVFVLYGYNGFYGYFCPSASVFFRVSPCSLFVLYGSYGFYGYFCSNTDFHGVSRNLCSSVSVLSVLSVQNHQNLRLAVDLGCTDVPEVLVEGLVTGVLLSIECLKVGGNG